MSLSKNISKKRLLLVIPAAFALLLLLVAVYIYFWPKRIDDRIRIAVIHALADRFHSDVELKTLTIQGFATPTVTGEGLTLRYHRRQDVPPLIQVEKFSFRLGILGLLHPVKRLSSVRVQNMLISIPPKEKNGVTNEKPSGQQRPPQPGSPTPEIVVDRVVCDNLDIRILPKQEGKEPLDWDIHNLLLLSAGADQPFAFTGNLTNGKPKGEIATHGRFGPWNAEEPGDTPVSGEYNFIHADLGPLPGIGGILSSVGGYRGVLSNLEVNGSTDTPDFSLDKVGKPVPLHTEFSATVDGTNGDTYLHPVNATLIKSLIVAVGRVVRMPEKKGHLISIDANVPNGRIQDFLSLAMNTDKPLLTGPVKLKAKLTIPPGQVRTIEKIVLDGEFEVNDGRWNSPQLREKLESLSRHALGKPQSEESGSAVSDLKGNFLLQNGVFQFRQLQFGVEGASVDLTGTYDLLKGSLDFAGHLNLEAKLSQIVTGPKGALLKPLDPLFSKKGYGTVLPIRITGTRDNPVFGVSVFHKTFDKHL
ncbi:MAG TPA: AsmA-like C-terminal region-containing protein [Verrucomicrobiae bacterium]|nr:AsmA-like C-terminal region-containing protein [Verrucomicrobiae bacterium]